MSSVIKCRYTAMACAYGERTYQDCFEAAEYMDECKHKEFHKPELGKYGRCENAYRAEREFEKTVKSYELDEYELKIGRKVIDTDDINYLEIDGRVIYDEEATCDDAH